MKRESKGRSGRKVTDIHTWLQVINSTLYTMCFTAMSSSTKRCELCLATSHTERECAQQGDPGMRERLKSIEAAVLAMTAKPTVAPRPPGFPPSKPSGKPCRKYNGPGCTYPRCRHSHTCSSCEGGHPATQCPTRPPYHTLPKHSSTPGRPY